jgi:hypothetical protein
MHAARQEAGAERRKVGIFVLGLRLEESAELRQIAAGTRVLEFHHMRDELVGPAGIVVEDVLRDRTYVQRLALDDHVFELQTVALEGVQGLRYWRRASVRDLQRHAASAGRRSVMRRRNTPITSR